MPTPMMNDAEYELSLRLRTLRDEMRRSVTTDHHPCEQFTDGEYAGPECNRCGFDYRSHQVWAWTQELDAIAMELNWIAQELPQ